MKRILILLFIISLVQAIIALRSDATKEDNQKMIAPQEVINDSVKNINTTQDIVKFAYEKN